MQSRLVAAVFGLVGLVAFVVLRPDAPSAGSDCEVLSTGWFREPVASLSSLAIVAAGWWAAIRRPIAGSAVLLAGITSLAAHSTAHPTARALDGIVATLAFVTVLVSLVRSRPAPVQLVAGVLVGCLAVVAWVLTRTDATLCEAVGPWGHAVWHVLVALGLILVVREPVPDSPSHPPA